MLGAILLTAACLNLCLAARPLPSYLRPCARSDPEFNKCALERGREVIPIVIQGDRKYNIPVLEPISVEEMTLSEAGTGAAGLTLILRDVKIYGTINSTLDKTDFDFEKKRVSYAMTIPRGMIIGKYEVKGRILLLPVTGNGDINMTMVNVKLNYEHDYVLETRDGVQYLTRTRSDATVSPDIAYFHLNNLFNGDVVLGKQMNIFLNENWMEVFKEMSPAIYATFAKIVDTIIDGITGSVPFDVAFPETITGT